MTLTLSPEIERVLAAEADKLGRTPDEIAEQTLRIKFRIPVGAVGPLGEKLRAQVNAGLEMPLPEEASAEEKEGRRQEALALIQSGYFRERLSSSEEFATRKAEEIALEERRWHK